MGVGVGVGDQIVFVGTMTDGRRPVGVEVGPGTVVAMDDDVGGELCTSFSLASTVASILGVGSTGPGAALEQASKYIPANPASTTRSFILTLNHRTLICPILYSKVPD